MSKNKLALAQEIAIRQFFENSKKYPNSNIELIAHYLDIVQRNQYHRKSKKLGFDFALYAQEEVCRTARILAILTNYGYITRIDKNIQGELRANRITISHLNPDEVWNLITDIIINHYKSRRSKALPDSLFLEIADVEYDINGVADCLVFTYLY